MFLSLFDLSYSKHVLKYTTDSYVFIINETSQGHGEYTEALYTLYGCDKKTHNVLIKNINKPFAAIENKYIKLQLDYTPNIPSY